MHINSFLSRVYNALASLITDKNQGFVDNILSGGRTPDTPGEIWTSSSEAPRVAK